MPFSSEIYKDLCEPKIIFGFIGTLNEAIMLSSYFEKERAILQQVDSLFLQFTSQPNRQIDVCYLSIVNQEQKITLLILLLINNAGWIFVKNSIVNFKAGAVN